MSADKISRQDIFAEADTFEVYNEGAKHAAENTKLLTDAAKELAAVFIKNGNGIQLVDAKSVSDLLSIITSLDKTTTSLQGLLKAGQEYEKLGQQQIKTEQLKKKVIDDTAKSEAKAAADKARASKQAIRDAAELTKQQNAQAKATAQAQSAYYKLSQQLINQKKTVKDLWASGKDLSSTDKQLIKDTQDLDDRLKHIDEQVGDNFRKVGAYREALNDITAEFGIMGGVVSKVARTLKVLQDQSGETNSKIGKLTNVIKAGLIGAAIALVGAIIAANDAANEFSETLKANSDALEISNRAFEKGRALALAYEKSQDPLATSLSQVQDAFEALVHSEIAHANAMRVLQIQQQKLSIEQSDFNQIANDTTIGYNERIVAQKKAFDLSEKIAAKNKEIAASDLAQANIAYQASLLISKNSNAETKSKLLEAQLKYNQAIADEGTVIYDNAQKERQINIDKANEEIDLLLKSKEAANARKQILEEELKDQRRSIEQRKQTSEDLYKYNVETANAELNIFKKGYNIKFNSNNLLLEQDSRILAHTIATFKTLSGHNLGEEGVKELAQIIKQAQDSQIERQKEIKALDIEELQIKQKLANLFKEQQLEEIEFLIKVNELKNKSLEDQEKANDDKVFGKKQVFNGKLINQHKNLKDQQSELIDQGHDDKAIELDLSAELERQKVEQSIEDERLKAAEILKINQKLAHDLELNDMDYENKKLELNNKEIEWQKKLSDERKKILKEEADTTIDFVDQSLKRKDALTEKQLENDLDMRQRNILQQQQLAEAGRNNTLAFEKAAAAKDELAKQNLAYKEQKREKAIAFFKLLAAYAEKGDTDQAVAKTLIQMAIASAITGSYKDGVEGLEGPGTATSDSIVARLSKGESVATASATRSNPGLVTAMNKDAVDEYFEKQYLPKYMTDPGTGSFGENIYNSMMLQQFASMNKEIKEMKQVLKDRPVSSTNLDNLGNVIQETVVRGLKKVVKRKNGNNYI